MMCNVRKVLFRMLKVLFPSLTHLKSVAVGACDDGVLLISAHRDNGLVELDNVCGEKKEKGKS